MRIVVLLALLVAASPAEAASKGIWRKLYRVSEVVVVGATALDAHSSFGGPEANPLLRSGDGRFRRRGVAVKFAVVGGVLLVERLLNRNHRHDQALAVSNLTVGGATALVAARNYRMRGE